MGPNGLRKPAPVAGDARLPPALPSAGRTRSGADRDRPAAGPQRAGPRRSVPFRRLAGRGRGRPGRPVPGSCGRRRQGPVGGLGHPGDAEPDRRGQRRAAGRARGVALALAHLPAGHGGGRAGHRLWGRGAAGCLRRPERGRPWHPVQGHRTVLRLPGPVLDPGRSDRRLPGQGRAVHGAGPGRQRRC